MRMSDQEYFRSCIAQERHLAQLLGHEVEEYYESAGTLWDNTLPLPKWTRDWRACGPLIAQFHIPLSYDMEPADGHGCAVIAGPVVVRFADHPSQDRAIMYAIVLAAIHHLEHQKGHKGYKGHNCKAAHPPHG